MATDSGLTATRLLTRAEITIGNAYMARGVLAARRQPEQQKEERRTAGVLPTIQGRSEPRMSGPTAGQLTVVPW